jgi:ABC-type sugar transport system, permease component
VTAVVEAPAAQSTDAEGGRPSEVGHGRTSGVSRRRARRILHYVVLVVVAIAMLAPLIWPMLASFKGPQENVFGANATILPRHWSLTAYRTLFSSIPVIGYVGNSLFYAALSIVSQVALSTMAGYMLSRKNWRGRGFITLLLIASMIFPFESIMLSLYTEVQNIGLLDSIVGVWLPGIVSVFNVMIMRTAFGAVPSSIEEAALLDGAGELKRFFSVFLPAARGAIVIIVLGSFIGAWDDFLWPLMVIHSDVNFTLTLGLSTIQFSAFGSDERVVLAGAVVALIPVVVIFFACQRYFFRGFEEGGVKF